MLGAPDQTPRRVVAVWSTKGGVGVSTVAALLATASASRAVPARLVDLCGDLPAIVGIADPEGPGVAEWATTPGRSVEALDRIAHPVAAELDLVARGAGPFDADASPLLSALSHGSSSAVQVIDCGRIDDPAATFGRSVAAGASDRLIVVRPCYVTLRRARALPVPPTGVVVVRDPRRSLTRADIESVIDAPVIAAIAVDPDIARAVDAGVITRRAPRRLLRDLATIVAAHV